MAGTESVIPRCVKCGSDRLVIVHWQSQEGGNNRFQEFCKDCEHLQEPHIKKKAWNWYGIEDEG